MTINEVIIAGRITKELEVKYTQNNTAVCKFSVALDRYMGEGKEKKTNFIPVVAWNKIAEFAGKYLGKGRKIIVKGSLEQNVWEDKEGRKHYDIEVWAEKIDFADSAKEGNGNGGSAQSDTFEPPDVAAGTSFVSAEPKGAMGNGNSTRAPGKMPWES